MMFIVLALCMTMRTVNGKFKTPQRQYKVQADDVRNLTRLAETLSKVCMFTVENILPRSHFKFDRNSDLNFCFMHIYLYKIGRDIFFIIIIFEFLLLIWNEIIVEPSGGTIGYIVNSRHSAYCGQDLPVTCKSYGKRLEVA